MQPLGRKPVFRCICINRTGITPQRTIIAPSPASKASAIFYRTGRTRYQFDATASTIGIQKDSPCLILEGDSYYFARATALAKFSIVASVQVGGFEQSLVLSVDNLPKPTVEFLELARENYLLKFNSVGTISTQTNAAEFSKDKKVAGTLEIQIR